MICDESFGIIPLRKLNNSWEVYLIQHRKHLYYWGFPKGHLEAGETQLQCAERELQEETSLTVVQFLPFPPFIDKFAYEQNGKKISKTVYYFLAQVGGMAHINDTKEIAQGTWITIENASTLMSHPTGKVICESLEKILSTVS